MRHEAAGESKAVTRPAGAETCPSVNRQQCRARGLSLSKAAPVTTRPSRADTRGISAHRRSSDIVLRKGVTISLDQYGRDNRRGAKNCSGDRERDGEPMDRSSLS